MTEYFVTWIYILLESNFSIDQRTPTQTCKIGNIWFYGLTNSTCTSTRKLDPHNPNPYKTASLFPVTAAVIRIVNTKPRGMKKNLNKVRNFSLSSFIICSYVLCVQIYSHYPTATYYYLCMSRFTIMVVGLFSVIRFGIHAITPFGI